LAGYRWWAPLLVGGAWLSTHFILRESSVWKIWRDPNVVDAQRHADYAYRLAVNAPAAKEVRLFGLADWAVDQFAARRTWLADALLTARRLHQGPLAQPDPDRRQQRPALLVAGERCQRRRAVVGRAVVFAQPRSAPARSRSAKSIGFQSDRAAHSESARSCRRHGTRRRLIPLLPRGEVIRCAIGTSPQPSPGARGKSPAVHAEQRIRFNRYVSVIPAIRARCSTASISPFPPARRWPSLDRTGAGKATLAKLICRLYDPDAGTVTVDGIDLRDLDVAAWRTRVAAVFQDFIRYELPLRDNVAPAGAGDEAVRAALQLARASDLCSLDTILSRAYGGGTDLSGGQWQRVALARALHAVQAGAGVVILDEPTAQLDVRGEAEIFDAILSATRGCTTILISHRFSTVRHADRICVLEAGRVVELGSHDELIARGGRYKTMFELQASRFWQDEETADAGIRA
jgi:ABC-type multidrug transport system ATPase subunit